MVDDTALLEAELTAAADDADGGTSLVTVGNSKRRIELRFDEHDRRAALSVWFRGERDGRWLRVRNGTYSLDAGQLAEFARGIATALQLVRETRNGGRR